MHRSLAFLTLIQFIDHYGQNVMVEPYLCVLIKYVKKFGDSSFGGHSQGDFPRQLLSLAFPVLFTHYLCTELERAQVHGQFHGEKETYHRLDPNILYRMVVVEEQYKWYSLHSPKQLNIFCGIIGSTSTIGIRKRKPKLGHEETTRLFDALNITSKMDLFISYGKVKVRMHAKWHIIGVDNTENALVLAQSNFNTENQIQLQQEASVL